MNLPNKLTMLRMCMIPLFLIFFFWYGIPNHYLWSLIVFAAASLTDMFDGRIARKRGLVTDFGKLMDPLADKLLVVSALCCLTPAFGILGTVSLILILSREFLVTSMRLIAAGKGEILAADNWGKLKTVTQMAWICLELSYGAFSSIFNLHDAPARVHTFFWYYSRVSFWLFPLMVAITAASGVHYIAKNRKLFTDA